MRRKAPARKLETRAPAHAAFEPERTLLQDPVAVIAGAQAVYYLGIGLWPLVHLRSFEVVTGPKLEGWLTKGVGACLANVGLSLGLAVLRDGRNRRKSVSSDLRGLGLRFALSFAAMDFWYAGVRRRISPVYLLNGVAQLGFAAAWLVAAGRRRHERGLPPSPAHA